MKKLNKSKLQKRIAAFVSTEDALKDVPPMEWPEEVINGNKRASVKAAEVEDRGCVRLEISS